MIQFKSFFKNTVSAIKIIWFAQKGLFLLNLFGSIVLGVLPLLIIYLSKEIVDIVSLDIEKDLVYKKAAILIGLTGGAFYLNNLFSSFVLLFKDKHSKITSDYVFGLIHKKATKLDFSYYENSEYHNLLFRATSEAGVRPSRVLNTSFNIIQNIISISIIAYLFLQFNGWVLFALVAIASPLLYSKLRHSKGMYDWVKSRTEDERKVQYLNRIISHKYFVKELKLFGFVSFIEKTFQQTRKKLRNESIALLRKKVVLEAIIQLFISVIIFWILLYVLKRTQSGEMTLGDLVMYFFLIQRGYNYINAFFSGISSIYEDGLFFSYLRDYLNLKSEIEVDAIQNNGWDIQETNFTIELKDVSFSYPGTSRKVLDGVSMSIPHGKKTALVGKNGAGKSTLIKLICRFYDPDSGVVFLNGVNIKEIPIIEYRSKITALFQDFILYNMTVKENTWLGDISKDIKSDFNEVYKEAGIYNKVESLKDGDGTMLGNLFSNSEELSLGEWQKLAFARALHRNSPIILLDEPTSSIDAQAEVKLLDNIERFITSKTTLIISHKFSMVKNADHIYVLNNNKIIESGSHDQLIAMNGEYAGLFKLQSDKYI